MVTKNIGKQTSAEKSDGQNTFSIGFYTKYHQDIPPAQRVFAKNLGVTFT